LILACVAAAAAGASQQHPLQNADTTNNGKVRYDGFQILKVKVPTAEALKLVFDLIALPESQVSWNSDSEYPDRKGYADLVVGPRSTGLFVNSAMFPEVEVVVADLQKQFDENELAEKLYPFLGYEAHKAARRQGTDPFWNAYREYDEIIEWFDGLIAEFPDVVRKIPSIGASYQGRDIWALVIGRNPQVAVFYNGLQHCREWIGGHSLLYTADSLVRRYGSDPNITSLLDNMEVHIVPVFNPDGYEFTRSNDNMWRKNRQPNSGSACIGTDLNRNWVYEWSTIGSSPNPCSDTFHGPSAMSGPEVVAIDSYVRNTTRIQGYIDWHSSGNLWMLPWGCYDYSTPDHNVLMLTGNRAAAAIASYRGTRFDVGAIYDIIYPVSGSSCDTTYAPTEMNRLQSYALEIGTTFQPLPSQIVPTGEEMLLGALVHMEDTLSFFLSKQKNGN